MPNWQAWQEEYDAWRQESGKGPEKTASRAQQRPSFEEFLEELPDDVLLSEAAAHYEETYGAPPEEESFAGAVARGFKSKLPQLQQSTGYALALGGEELRRRDVGFGEALRDYGLGVAKRADEKLEASSQPYDSFSGAHETGQFGKFLGFNAGQGAASLVESGLPAALGAFLGSSMAPGPGTVAGAAAGVAGRKATLNRIGEEGKRLAAEQTKRRYRDTGALLGATPPALMHGMGQNTQASIQAEGDIEDIDTGRVAQGGGISTVINYIGALPLLYGMGLTGSGKMLAGNRLARAGQIGGVTAVGEGIVGAGDVATTRWVINEPIAAEGTLWDYIDGVMGGAIQGGTAGALGGAIGPGPVRLDEPPPLSREELKERERLALPNPANDPYIVHPDGTIAKPWQVQATLRELERQGRHEEALQLRSRLVGYAQQRAEQVEIASQLEQLPEDPVIAFRDGSQARLSEVEAQINDLESRGLRAEVREMADRLHGLRPDQPPMFQPPDALPPPQASNQVVVTPEGQAEVLTEGQAWQAAQERQAFEQAQVEMGLSALRVSGPLGRAAALTTEAGLATAREAGAQPVVAQQQPVGEQQATLAVTPARQGEAVGAPANTNPMTPAVATPEAADGMRPAGPAPRSQQGSSTPLALPKGPGGTMPEPAKQVRAQVQALAAGVRRQPVYFDGARTDVPAETWYPIERAEGKVFPAADGGTWAAKSLDQRQAIQAMEQSGMSRDEVMANILDYAKPKSQLDPATTQVVRTRDPKGNILRSEAADAESMAQAVDKALPIAARADGEVSIVPPEQELYGRAGLDASEIQVPSRPAPLEDPRLEQPAYRSDLESMASQAGWAEEGGKLITRKDRVTRTTWIPKSPWWKDRPQGVTEKTVRSGVQKALAGDPLNANERRSVTFLLNLIDAYETLSDVDGMQEFDAFLDEVYTDLTDDQIAQVVAPDPQLFTERADYERYLRESEKRDSAEAGPNVTRAARQGDRADAGQGRLGERGAQPGASDRDPGGHRGDSRANQGAPEGFELTTQTPEQLRQQAEAEQARQEEAERQRLKEQVDAEVDSFRLTGSNRPADQAMAAGQRSLLDQPTAQEPIFSREDLPADEVSRAYSHTSMRPGDAAKVEQNSYVEFMEGLRDSLKKDLPKGREADLNAELQRIKGEYLRRRRSVLNARENTVSSHIAGRSKFNQRQASARGNALDRAEAAFADWLRTAEQEAAQATGVAQVRTQRKIERAEQEQLAKQTVDRREAETKKARRLLPIVNDPSAERHMTRVEWAAIPRDYKSVMDGDGYRYRSAMEQGGMVRVYITDMADKLPPAKTQTQAPTASEPSRPAQGPRSEPASFSPNDTAYLFVEATQQWEPVNFRGPHGEDQAVVVRNGQQWTVPMAELRAEKPASTEAQPESAAQERATTRKTLTYRIAPADGGFHIVGANHEGEVLARRPNGPGILNTVPRRLFKTDQSARDYLAKHGMQEQAAQDTRAEAPAQEQADLDTRLRNQELSIAQYLERRKLDPDGYTDQKVGGMLGDIRQRAAAETEYGRLIEEIRQALHGYKDSPAKQMQLDTLREIERNFEHPFRNDYVTRLSPGLVRRFGRRANDLPLGETAKREQRAAEWRIEAEQVIRYADQAAQEQATAEAQPEAAPETAAQAEPQTLVGAHEGLFERLREGRATADEFKAAFEGLVENRDAIVAELSAMTKAEILQRFPGTQFRYRNEKKATVVDAAYLDIIGDFALGKTISYGMRISRDGPDPYVEAVRKMVDQATDQSLAEYAEAVAKARQERTERRREIEKGLEDPQTVEDFQRLLHVRAEDMGEGVTFGELRMTLTPEQRKSFDTLMAQRTRGQRSARTEAQPSVQAPGATTGAEIVATKHTRDGYDLFVVKPAERVARDDYKTWLATAKTLGGWYSAFRGQGAVPGFQFKTRESAQAFLKYITDGAMDGVQQQAQDRRDAFVDDRSQTAIERLNEMADRLEDRANTVLSQGRKVNTERRARMAASAEASAEADKALAQTMRNIANAIGKDEAQFLDQVRQKAQVEMLDSMVRTAQGDKLRALYPEYAQQEKHRGEPADLETADYATFPTYTAFRSDLAGLGRALLETEGTKKLGQRIMKVADDVTDAYLNFARENLPKVARYTGADGVRPTFANKARAEAAIQRSGYRGAAIVLPVKRGENMIVLSPSEAIKQGVWSGDNDKRITLSPDLGAEIVEKLGRMNRRTNRDVPAVPWQFESAHEKRKRLAAIGIQTPAELRAALREFIELKQPPKERDKIKEMERAMVGRRNDGLDFFPTPESVADEMVSVADIQEGMMVLEPSAGMGHIAERIREAGVEPDVVEVSSDRRELLVAKGFNVVGNDFLEVSQKYDRIVMNPPFSKRRDAEHVQHAYDLLNPGGRLVAIMGEGVFFGSDQKAQNFREWLERVEGTSEKLPEGTFTGADLPVNTGVNARMVVIEKSEGTTGVSEPDAAGNVALYSRSEAGPLASLTGQEVGEVTPETAIQVARRYYRENLQGQTIHRPEIGDIRVTGKGWHKLKRGMVTDLRKVQMLPAIPQIIENGQYHGREPVAGRNDDIVAFHFFDGYIDLSGERLQAGVTVAEDSRGNLLYNLNHDADLLWQRRKARHEPGSEAQGGEPFAGSRRSLTQSIGVLDSGFNLAVLSVEPPARLTAAGVRESLRPITETLRVPTDVHADVAAAREATGLDIPSDANGFFWRGRVNLIASAHDSIADAEGTLWHEIEHAGVAAVFGEDAAGYMRAMNRIALHNANIRKAAAEWTRNFGADRLRDLNERGIKGERAQKIVRAHAIEEALADLSKAHGKDIRLKGLRQFINDIVQWMRARGFKALPDLIERLTDAEALGMIAAARDAVMVDGAKVFKGETAAFSKEDPAPQGWTMGVAKGTESARPAGQEAGLAESLDPREGDSNPEARAPLRDMASSRLVRTEGMPRDAKHVSRYRNMATLKAQPDYKAAKAGDREAALRLVRGLVNDQFVGRAIEEFGSATFVYPHAEEASGRNAIPAALANILAARSGGKIGPPIAQMNRTHHTGAKMMERMISRPVFQGEVETGARYVVVDDVTTSGSTLAEMADHILAGGGQVVGSVVLVDASRTATMTPTPAQIRNIERRYGDAIREIFNVEPNALTASEASYVLDFRDADALRSRAASAGRQRTERLLSKGISPDSPQVASGQSATESVASDPDIRYSRQPPPQPTGFAGPRVEHWTRNFAKLRGFFESAADTLRRTPGLEPLGEALRVYYDRTQANRATVNQYEQAAKEALGKLSKSERKQVLEDFAWYRAAVENGRTREAQRILANANPTLQTLIDNWQQIADVTGKMARDAGVMVRDAKTGQWRPMGKARNFWPRTFSEAVQKALDAPHKHAEKWNELVDALYATGQFADHQEAANYLIRYRNEMGDNLSDQDYFAGIEMGRSDPLPEAFYDYSWEAGLLYKEAWADRLGQIQAFGQTWGDGPQRNLDLFDRTLQDVRDDYTRSYLLRVRSRAYKENYNDPIIQFTQSLNTLATGIQLGNPATALLNLIGGTSLTFQAYGIRRSLAGLLQTATGVKRFKDQHRIAFDLGILQDDYLNIMHDSERSGTPQWLRKFTGGMLKYGGYTPAEHFIRTHNMVVGKAFLNDALRELNTSPGSNKAARYAKWIQRQGFDVDQLVQENGRGEYTDRFIRGTVNLTQGSYRIDQTPVFVDTVIGRFLFKYQKFGTQLSRMFWMHHLKPFVDSINGGDKVTYEINGQQYSARLFHFLPLLRFFGVSMAAGMIMMDWREELFGYQNKAPTLAMIDKALQDDETARATALMAERAFQGGMAVGMFGFFGNYYQLLWDVADRQRVKSPLSPPALAPLEAVGEFAMRAVDQKALTARDVDTFLQQSVALYRTAKRGTANLGAGEIIPWQELQVQAAKSDVAFVKKVTRQYASDAGIEAKRRSTGTFAPTVNSAFNNRMIDAILVGDVARAQLMMRDHFNDRERFPSEDEKRNAMLSLKSAVRSREPSRVGVAPSDAVRLDFLRWARANTTPEEYARIRRISDEYRRSARRLGLL